MFASLIKFSDGLPHFTNFYIYHSLYFECKDTSFPFSTYAICAICVDSGNKVRKISWNHSEEYLRRIRNYLRKIAEYLRRIKKYLRKIAENLRRINPENKCRESDDEDMETGVWWRGEGYILNLILYSFFMVFPIFDPRVLF